MSCDCVESFFGLLGDYGGADVGSVSRPCKKAVEGGSTKIVQAMRRRKSPYERGQLQTQRDATHTTCIPPCNIFVFLIAGQQETEAAAHAEVCLSVCVQFHSGCCTGLCLKKLVSLPFSSLFAIATIAL